MSIELITCDITRRSRMKKSKYRRLLTVLPISFILLGVNQEMKRKMRQRMLLKPLNTPLQELKQDRE